MRTQLLISGIVILLCSAFFFSDKSKLITRRWILVDFKSPSIEANFESIGMTTERRAEIMKNMVNGSYVEFRNDGTYEVSILGSEPETLLWSLSDNDSILLVRKSHITQQQSIEIETLTKNELVMLLPDINNQFTRMFFVPDPDSGKVEE